LTIPLEVNEISTCNFGPRSKIAQVLHYTHLIIWDEAPMDPRFTIEAADRTMQDSLGNNEPFGDKVALFGGDFRQILPVVLGGYRSQTVWKCLKMSIQLTLVIKSLCQQQLLVQYDICGKDFKIPWLFLENVENLICFCF
jgi:PIF1-like helicase